MPTSVFIDAVDRSTTHPSGSSPCDERASRMARRAAGVYLITLLHLTVIRLVSCAPYVSLSMGGSAASAVGETLEDSREI